FKTGGLNFDAKVRRESTDLEDLFIAHIGGMDCYARGLLIAHEILEKSSLAESRRERYSSFDSGQGQAFAEGRLSLEDLREYAAKHGEPRRLSGRQEWVENVINDFIFRVKS
ncbi:MAG: xylose isomerase, partial [Woeseia sp.]